MSSQVAERTASGDSGIRHPAPFIIEPAADGPSVTVGVTDPCNGTEGIFFDELFDKEVMGDAAHKVSGLEENAGFPDDFCQFFGIIRGESERFFHEDMFPGFRHHGREFFVG